MSLRTHVDGLIDKEQGDLRRRDLDPEWDGVMTSEARITDREWTATIEIPFSMLNITQSKEIVRGLNFKRFIRRTNEEDLCATSRVGTWESPLNLLPQYRLCVFEASL